MSWLPDIQHSVFSKKKMDEIDVIWQNSSLDRCSNAVESVSSLHMKNGMSNILATPPINNNSKHSKKLKLAADYSVESVMEKMGSNSYGIITKMNNHSTRLYRKKLDGGAFRNEAVSINPVETEISHMETCSPRPSSQSSFRNLKKQRLSDKFSLSSESDMEDNFSTFDANMSGSLSVSNYKEMNCAHNTNKIATLDDSVVEESIPSIDSRASSRTSLYSFAETSLEFDSRPCSQTSNWECSSQSSLIDCYDESDYSILSRTNSPLKQRLSLTPSLAESYVDLRPPSRSSLRLLEKRKKIEKSDVVINKAKTDNPHFTRKRSKSKKLLNPAGEVFASRQSEIRLQRSKKLKLPVDQHPKTPVSIDMRMENNFATSKMELGPAHITDEIAAVKSVVSSSVEQIEYSRRSSRRASLIPQKNHRFSDEYVTFSSKNGKPSKIKSEKKTNCKMRSRKTVETLPSTSVFQKMPVLKQSKELKASSKKSAISSELKSEIVTLSNRKNVNSVSRGSGIEKNLKQSKECGTSLKNVFDSSPVKSKTDPVSRVKKANSISEDGILCQNYKVEKIVDHCTSKNKRYYFVKWAGWSSYDNTWEPEEHLKKCEDILKTYKKYLRQIISEKNFFSSQEYIIMQKKLVNISKARLEKLMAQYGKQNGIPYTVRSEEEVVHKMKSLLRYPQKRRKPKTVKKIINDILIRAFDMYRMAQLDALKEWEEDMNNIATEKSKIVVENFVDLEGPPENFTYVNDYIAGEGVVIPNEPPFGCCCGSKCYRNSKNCCPTVFDHPYAYSRKCRLVVELGTPIYECNDLCKCTDKCANRVVQKGRKINLCIFRTSNGCGWGVKTLQEIKAGSFICEYVGEVIKTEEAERRGEKYDAVGRTYLFDLDFFEYMCPYSVDAAKYGNISHFVNHSCSPNAAVFAVWINCRDPNLPKLALFSKADINAGEELTFDYELSLSNARTENSNIPLPSSSRSRLALPNRGKSPAVSTTKIKCRCGSAQCRKFLFYR